MFLLSCSSLFLGRLNAIRHSGRRKRDDKICTLVEPALDVDFGVMVFGNPFDYGKTESGPADDRVLSTRPGWASRRLSGDGTSRAATGHYLWHREQGERTGLVSGLCTKR